jgi:Metallo-peptidase family M12/IPT/TIG domain/S-layer homology domain
MKALRLMSVFAAAGLLLAGSAVAQRPVDERPFRALDAPLAVGATVVLEPVALDDGTDVVLEVSRVEVFTKGAEIVVHGPDGDSLAPLPSDRWFTGRVSGDPESLVMLARGRGLRGFILTGTRSAVIGPEGDMYAERPGRTVVRTFSPETDVPEAMRGFTCGTESLLTPHHATAMPPSSRRRPLSSVMYYAGIAIETDYEMYVQKGSSATALAQYVGDLFAAVSFVYQRDLLVTMQVNYLSIWATASDPWVAADTITALYEFGDYWHANRSGVPRTTAHFLSGKNLGGGVAWLGTICWSDFLCSGGSCGSGANGHYGGGYGFSASLSGTAPANFTTTYWDFLCVSHEIGHNFGSPHTHCYSPPVDQCYSGEGPGCYLGPTSVPAVKGTIMSYCHLLPGGYSNTKMFFGVAGEPSAAVTTLMRGTYIEQASCLGTVAGPTVSGISPPTGPPTGGTSVTISGSGFAGGATVKIGGSSATSVVVVNATTITAGTPAHAIGAADVTVTNPGNHGYTFVGGYTYLCTSVSPTAGNTGPYCAGSTISLSTPTVSGATYAWTGPNGFTSALQNPTIPNATVANAGQYSVTVTVPGCSPPSPGMTSVTVNPTPTPHVTAPASALPGTTGLIASVPLHTGNSYLWGITNGAITGGAGTNQITFTAGPSGVTVLTVVETTIATGCASPTATANVYINAEPAGLVEDAHANGGTISNVNNVLEPSETVLVNASWRNVTASPLALTGTASAFTGPAGAIYSLLDSSAGYGTIPPGATVDSFTAGLPSYRLSVSNPATRPAAHWDATFLETLSNGVTKTWTLHVGQSFSDVPVSNVSYASVENIFHNGITTGCAAGLYCPAVDLPRWQMAIFLARSILGSGVTIPTSGTVSGVGSYNCTGGGSSLFTDVAPTDVACPAIHFIYSQGITTGCGPGIFCPNTLLPRWQMAIFLARSMLGPGVPIPASGSVSGVGSYDCTGGGASLFTDVPKTDVACPAIHYIYSQGVTTGCGPGIFCPNTLLPRWQMAIFLVRAFHIPFLY